MKDNKGQSLVLFILLLPISLGIMALVIDIGNAIIEKNKMNNTIEMVLEMALEDHLNDKEIQNLLNKNLTKNQNLVVEKNNKIVIVSDTNTKGIFSKIFGFQGFEIKSEYIGETINDKIVITKKE